MNNNCVLLLAIFLTVSNALAAATNYRWWYQLVRTETSSHDEVDGHAVVIMREKYIFSDGFTAVAENIAPDALIIEEGEWLQTETVTFDDGKASSIIIKRAGNLKRTDIEDVSYGEWTGEIVGGTGRFAGIHGTERGDADFRQIESGDVVSGAMEMVPLLIVFRLHGN